MRNHGARRGQPYALAYAEHAIAARNREISEKNSQPQPIVVLTGPARRNQRPKQRPHAATTQAECSCRSSRRAAASMLRPWTGKLSRSHHREDHPTRPDHQFARLGEHRRKKRGDGCGYNESLPAPEKSPPDREPAAGVRLRRAARRISCRRSGSPTPGTKEHSGRTPHRVPGMRQPVLPVRPRSSGSPTRSLTTVYSRPALLRAQRYSELPHSGLARKTPP